MIISHRGNVFGSVSEHENSPNQILSVLYKGFHCEIDIWKDSDVYQGFWLGHDAPEYPVPPQFLSMSGLWIHCKNIEAWSALKLNPYANVFMHTDEPYAITSFGYKWTTNEELRGPDIVRMVVDRARLKYAKIAMQTQSIHSYCCDDLT